jgi:hypothetical protein
MPQLELSGWGYFLVRHSFPVCRSLGEGGSEGGFVFPPLHLLLSTKRIKSFSVLKLNIDYCLLIVKWMLIIAY